MLNFFLKADKGADMAVRWGGLYLLLSSAFTWLSKNAPAFGDLTWPEAILLGIAMALAAMLIFSASLALFRIFRPLPHGAGTVPAPDKGAGGAHDSALRRTVDAHGSILTSMSSRLDSLGEESASDKAILSNLGGSIEQIREAQRGMETQFLAAINNARETASREATNIQLALKAIYHRERLAIREAEIRALGDILIAPSESGQVVKDEAWAEWEKTEIKWQDKLDLWCELAEVYVGNVRDSVFAIPQARLKENWGANDDQFPNATAVISYNTFRVTYANWLSVRDVAEQRVLRAAYGGQANQIIQEAHE